MIILRILNSPYANDLTRNATLSHQDVDSNFIYLKGHIIYEAENNGGLVTLKKYNGETIIFSASTGGSGGSGGSDTYWTSGSTGVGSIKAINSTGLDATGTNAVAINHATLASGQFSLATGVDTIASGASSSTFGVETVAGGVASHAEGFKTSAIGYASHAGGSGNNPYYVVANGNTSFVHQYNSGSGQFGAGNYGTYANYSAILGGKDHYMYSGSESGAIMGGNGHLLFGISINSGIFGGDANLLIDTFNGVVLGGTENGTIQADSSAVIGGYNNLIDAFAYYGPAYGFIGGGSNNKIQTGGGVSDESSAIIGGNGNSIIGDNQYNGIYNSFDSTLTNQDTSTIIGSYESYINDNTGGLESNNNAIINASNSYINGYGISHANILGGANNSIYQTVDGVNQPNYTSILNGYGNQILDSDTAVIFNGFTNSISGNSKQSTILNGQFHSITSSKFAAIIGGNSNEMADSDGSALIGGSDNSILSDNNPAFTRYYNAIIGGTGNTINNSELSFIMGGYQNVIPYGKVGVVILGGDSITGSTNNTVYVQRLNIKNATNDNTTTRFLTLDANNNITFRNLSSISGSSSGSTGGDTLWASGTTGIGSIKAINSTGLDANGDYAVAINNSTMADGDNSFAAGYSTWARGISSMSVGQNTESFGDYSFAGGHNTIATGNLSFIWSTESTVTGIRSAVIGGSYINGLSADTVYVPYLNVQSATTDNTLTSFLVRATDGTIKTRSLPTDIRVTGGTYTNGNATFTNNSGGTFTVTGFKTSDTFVTGGTYSNFTGTAIFTNNSGSTFNVTGFSTGSTSVTGFTYLNNNLTVKQSSGDLSVNINTMTGLTINGNLTYTGQANNPVYTAGTVTATHTPNWNNSNIQHVILSAATTTIANGTNVKNGAVYTMIIKQNATGSRVVTWGSQYKWQSGIAPILTSISNAVDIFTFISDGTDLYGLIAKDFR
jgi:hypothetical protein